MITYLGCSGYLLEAPGAALLIDPYFSRHGMLRLGLNAKIPTHEKRLEQGLELARIPAEVDAILVTHGHVDHLPDVPDVQVRHGGVVVASETSCHLANAAGLPKDVLKSVHPGDIVTIGTATVHVLQAGHDRLFGKIPIQGCLHEPPESAPERMKDWICGETLAFLIELGDRRIYMDSGGMAGMLPDEVARNVDLAIIGAALPDSRNRFVETVRYLQPTYVLPNHQDNFFIPVTKGFRFGPLTNFPAVKRAHEENALGETSQLMLLDYFKPWRIP